MKHILNRFLTLVLVVAMLATFIPAVMPAVSADELPLESGIIGLALSYEGGLWQSNEYGFVGGTKTIAAEGCGGGTVYTPEPSRLTMKNDTSQPATLSFDYIVQLNSGTITIAGGNIAENGSYEVSLSPWQTIEIDVISSDAAETTTGIQLYHISFTVEEDVHVSFSAPSHGSYTVDGVAVTEQTEIQKSFGERFAVSATPDEGYTFLGWFNDLTFTCLSTNLEDSLLITADCVVYPYFFNENTLQFKVNEATFTDLNTANSYASAHDHAPIVLLSDGELPAGTYTVSQGNTLLIPCDGEFSLFTTDPDAVEQLPNFNNTGAYRTLTLASGANLIINGALSIGGRQNMRMPSIGSTSGDYGFVNLQSGSSITVNNGGKLYAWGYISGEGTVTAKKGSTVYEPFQVADFRGGDGVIKMTQQMQRVFPISQYYVQNIESEIIFEYGARELVRTVTNAGGGITSATVPFIDKTGANALFCMDNGTTLSKRYDAANDRLVFDLNGDAAINAISLTILDKLNINSADYVLPLNGAYTVNIHSGITTINQNMELLPGAVINVDNGAEIRVPLLEDPENPANPTPIGLIVYDADEWGGYCGHENRTFYPISYTPAGSANLRDSSHPLVDATLNVNGIITVEGVLATTQSGANITSSEGTGKIMFASPTISDSAGIRVFQAHQESVSVEGQKKTETVITYEAQPVYSAKLRNQAGNPLGQDYTLTAGTAAGTPFSYVGSYWTNAPCYDITYSVMGAAVQTETDVNSVLGTTLPEAVANGPQGYTFVGWSETEIEDEAGSADVLTGSYAPQDDVTLYAVFVRTVSDFVKVTQTEDFDGDYLIVYEGAGKAFNSAAGTTATALNKSGNYLPVTITDGRISSTEALQAAAVTIHPVAGTGHYSIQVSWGSYLGNTGGTSTGFNVNKSMVYENTITVTNGVATIQNIPATGTNTYTLKFNTSSKSDKFGFFKSSTSAYKMPALYRKGLTFYTTKLACLHENYTPQVTAPTCTEQGYTTNICDNCGYRWIVDPTPEAGHTFSAVITEPTQTEQGYTTYTCDICNYTYDGSFVDPFGFDYTVTCIAQGEEVYSDVFNSLRGSGLPATAPSVEGYIFRGWSETQIPQEVNSLTVLTGVYKPVRDITLYAVYTRSEAAAEANGNYEKVANGDPIYSGGKYLVVCENAGTAFNGAAERLDEGNFTEITVDTSGERKTIAATAQLDAGALTLCPVFGTANYTMCLADGRYIGNTGSSAGINASSRTLYENRIGVDANGAARIENVSEKGSYTLRYQSKFSYYKVTNNVPQPVSLYYKTGTGVQLWYTTEPNACLHPNATAVVTAPTCKYNGYTTHTCPACGVVWTDTEVEALGHIYNNGVQTAPSEANAFVGYTTYTCSRCGDFYREDFHGVDFTLQFSVRGTLKMTICANSYTGINLPGIAVEDQEFGYEFVGWSEQEIDPEYPAANVKSGLYKPTRNITLYATFARYQTQTGYNSDYVRINRDTNFASGGSVLAVYEERAEGAIVFNGNHATSTVPLYSAGNYIPVTIREDGTIAYSGSLRAAEIKVMPISGTPYYTMQIANDKYIGSTGSTPGINQNKKPNYKTRLYIDETNHAVIENIGGKNTYNFCYNDGAASDRFGFYKPTGAGACPIALYYRPGSSFVLNYTTNPSAHEHEYELYDETPATCEAAGSQTFVCLCGATEETALPALGHEMGSAYTETPVTCTTDGITVFACIHEGCTYSEAIQIPATGHVDQEPTLDGLCDTCGEVMPRIISAELRLDADLDLLYTVILPEGFDSARMRFDYNGTTTEVNSYTSNADHSYTFAFEGINPQCMGDLVNATLLVRMKNEQTDYTDVRENYSVRQYCVNLLAKEDLSAEVRTLLSDLLAYGAAAQTYMNYKTDAPVNVGSDIVNPTYSADGEIPAAAPSLKGTSKLTYWASAGLTLTSSVAMRFRFYARNKAGLSVKITINGREQTFTDAQFTAVEGKENYYEVSFAGISAEEFADDVIARFYRNGKQVGTELTYSVNAYAYAKRNAEDASLAALVRALYRYGVSAAALPQ